MPISNCQIGCHDDRGKLLSVSGENVLLKSVRNDAIKKQKRGIPVGRSLIQLGTDRCTPLGPRQQRTAAATDAIVWMESEFNCTAMLPSVVSDDCVRVVIKFNDCIKPFVFVWSNDTRRCDEQPITTLTLTFYTWGDTFSETRRATPPVWGVINMRYPMCTENYGSSRSVRTYEAGRICF